MEKGQLTKGRAKLIANIVFWGLFLSENSTVIDFYDLFSVFHAPIFTFLFILSATLLALGSLFSQFYNPHPETAFIIQSFQCLGLIISEIILKTLINAQNNLSNTTIICLVLIVVQSLLVLTKILYYGSVLPGQIAQNSNLLKLTRTVKITLFAILPIFVHSKAAYVIIFASFQLTQTFLFCFKFTYQQSSIEYILMIGVIGGLVSTFEAIISLIIGTPHFFLGQCLMIALYFVPDLSLMALLEIKYLKIVSIYSLREGSETVLALFRFMRECLFEEETSIQFSKIAKGKCWLLFVQLLKLKNGISKIDYSQEQRELWVQLLKNKNFQQKQFFELICQHMIEKTHYQILAFKIDCALKLKQHYIKHSLIMYYDFQENVKNNINVLERCTLRRVYKQINKSIYEKKSDFAPAHFINFDQLLTHLSAKIKECVSFELELIKFVSKQNKHNKAHPDDLLVKRYQLKEQVNSSIMNLLTNNLYANSNQFKYLFLVFHLSIVKEPQLLTSLIKTYFSCKQANQKLIDSTFDYFIILDGSNNGQILNCNQNFKNKFKLNSQLIYNDKGTINKLFPTVVQAKNHILKMDSSKMQAAQTQQNHFDFSCVIVVQTQIQGMKFNALQSFIISTRIFYQNTNGFNYICQFQETDKNKPGRVTLHVKEYHKLQKLSPNAYKKQRSRKITQLEEQIQLVDIYMEDQDESITMMKNEESKFWSKIEGLQNDRFRNAKYLTSLQEKLDIIQKKIIQTKQESKYKWSKNRILELFIFLGIILALWTSFISIQKKIELIQNAASQKHIVKDACLTRNKMMVTQLIRKMLSSSLYPSNVCNSYFQNFSTFLKTDMKEDLSKGFDKLLGLVVDQSSSESIQDALYSQANYAQNYLVNFRGNMSFIKYVHLLKASFYEELHFQTVNQTKPIDSQFYYEIFPRLLRQSSFSGKNSPYPLIEMQTDMLYKQFQQFIIILRPVSCFLCALLIIVAVLLRLRDTQKILDYLSILQNSPCVFLRQRQKQLSYTRNLLERLRYSYIYEIEVQDENFNVRSNQKLLETINDQSVFRKNVQSNKKKRDSKTVQCEEQQLSFLGNKNKISYIDITLSSKIKNLAFYNKNYLLVALSLLFVTIYSLPNSFELYLSKVMQLQSFDKVTVKLSQIQQKYINLVAFNWLKTTSIPKKFNITAANQLFNDTISYLQTAQYQNTVFKYYPRQIANEMLYQDACKYLPNPKQCNKYRNGVFNSGSSVLLPLTINQELQISSFQQDFRQNFPNLCDKTFLLYKIVAQFENKLPLAISQRFQGNNDAVRQLGVYVSIVLLAIWSLAYQLQISKREHIVLKQLLSLDYVENLYTINEFKPLFNSIFYK